MQVGTVAELWRYPVKSMAGERLDAADISWYGVAGDRRWAFIRPGLERSRFPWLTIRERPEMALFRPAFAEPDRPDDSDTVVHTPEGEALDVADPALAARLGDGVRLMRQGRGIQDSAPLSLISTATIARLGELVGRELDVRRFRPNLLVEGAGAFAEDAWVGSVLRIGEARMRVDRRDQRCVMINVDPDTTDRDARVLRTVAQRRESCLGVYGATVTPGRIAAGDPVVLEG
jgi:uncharacterized protein YcbX